ncbi:MAG: TIGR00730 family Rossman fold protein [Bacteroidota bacterium]
MKRIAVFCGSSSGTEVIFEKEAQTLGQTFAKENIDLVYGGANVGLMGALANATLSGGGNVIGVIPTFLKSKEIAHLGLTELHIVASMHERKTKMNDLCDGAIALPGGFGTLEELFEMLTWGQLGLHQKPVGLLNVNGFYDELIQLMDTMVEKGFLKEVYRKLVLISNNPNDLLAQMRTYEAPKVGKWITRETT